MSFWDSAWSAVSDAASWLGDAASSASNWMSNNKEATNLIGSTLLGVGSYLAQKEANKDLMKQQRELLNMQDALKSQYSAVPDVDVSYNSLTVDNSPGLANGGILTEMQSKLDRKNKGI
ncbi:MAG: hypothetical protein E7E48_08000 [Haemophilus parainfluenzae]|nr:hypothetical protein [Haemophilus parainfluenzae]